MTAGTKTGSNPVSYAYTGDRLTEANGTAITYHESVGLPKEYECGITGVTGPGENVVYPKLYWDANRSLEGVTSISNDNDRFKQAEYEYNGFGVRTEKKLTSNNTAKNREVKYHLDGARVMGLTREFDYGSGKGVKKADVKFRYGASGVMFAEEIGAFNLDGTPLQGVSLIKNKYRIERDAGGSAVKIMRTSWYDTGSSYGPSLFAEIEYGAFGEPKVVGGSFTALNGTYRAATTLTDVCDVMPFLWKGYIFDAETGLYSVYTSNGTRYYSPLTGRFLTPCAPEDIMEAAASGVIDGFNAYAIGNPLNLPANCFNFMPSISFEGVWIDPSLGGSGSSGGWKGWTLIGGIGRVLSGVIAVVVGAALLIGGGPVGWMIVAGVTVGAGVLTTVNGAADIGEYATGYNFMRDGLFNDVLGWSDTAYNWYAGITEGVAIAGSLACGWYAKSTYFMKGAVPGSESKMVLQPGMELQRYGSQYGRYLTNVGTPASQLLLPASNSGQLTRFVVTKSFRVSTGIVQGGGGFQYFTWRAINKLIKARYLLPI